MSRSERSTKKKQAESEQLESLLLLEALSRTQETRLQMQHLTALTQQAIFQSRRLIAEVRTRCRARKH